MSAGGFARGARVLAVELAKLRAQRAFWIVTLVLLAAAKGLVLWEVVARGPGDGLEDVSLNGFFVAARSAGLALAAWALLLTVAAAQSIAGELERGQLRAALVRPVSRRAHYLGKLAALAAVVALAVAADLVLALGVGGGVLGFSDVADVSLQGEAYGAPALWGEILLAYARTGLALVATAAVALAASAVARQATAAITGALGAIAAAAGAAFVLGAPVDRWIFWSWNLRSFERLEHFTAGTTVYRTPGDAWLAVLVPVLTALGATLLGLLVFTRRDVTS